MNTHVVARIWKNLTPTHANAKLKEQKHMPRKIGQTHSSHFKIDIQNDNAQRNLGKTQPILTNDGIYLPQS